MKHERGNFKLVMAGLLMLTALILFGLPSVAHAHGVDSRTATTGSFAYTMTADAAPHPAVPVLVPATVGSDGSFAEAAVPPAMGDDDDCGTHGGAASSGCCIGSACPMMHSGVPPMGQAVGPNHSETVVPLPSALLAKGIGTLPALRPPRASV